MTIEIYILSIKSEIAGEKTFLLEKIRLLPIVNKFFKFLIIEF